jgi:hypothetical protein
MFNAEDFNFFKIVACGLFGAIGFVAFVYGKRQSEWKPMITGALLMAYPYFISDTIAIYLIGAVLTASLYFWRE